MKLLVISVIAAVALVVAVTSIPRSHTISTGRAGTGGPLALEDMQSGPSAEKLPVEDFDDRSLVFPREAKR